MKIIGKIITTLFLTITLFLVYSHPVIAEDGANQLRTNISNDSPLLLSAVYGNDQGTDLWWGNTLEGAWAAIPDDVKPYAAIELHPAKVAKPTSCIPKDSPELRAWYTKMLDKAQKNNIPVFLVIMSAGERNTVPATWLAEQFEKYSVLKGVLNIENYWIYNNQLAPNSAKYLEVCAKYGGHFIWHDHEKWFWETIMRDDQFFEAAKKYHKNLVLATKNTPIRDDAGTDSIVNGFWLSGLCDNWGASTDTWKWWEKHYTDTFETGRRRDMRSYASEPEAMIAMEMMNVYTGGGTVYNFECAAYTFMTNDVPTPAFLKGIIPFFRHAIHHPAPSKQEVINRTKTVFWSGEGGISSLGNFYTGLYSDDETMPLYDTGRYHILPVIPEKISREEVETVFPNATILTKNSPELANRVAYLNSRYPELYQGDAYAQRVGNDWYFYNSNINIDKNQRAVLPMYVNNLDSVEIDMTAHTYGMISEKNDSLTILLNNYRTDKSEMWSLTGNFEASQSWKQGELDLADWLSENYSVHPADKELRPTVLTFRGQKGEKPYITVTGDEGHYHYQEKWNAETELYTLTILHNGRVEIELATNGDGPTAYPEPEQFDSSRLNLAYGKTSRQSSTDYSGHSSRANDGVIDGDFSHGSVTHTRADAPSWWEVDLGINRSVGNVTVYNRTDAEPQRLSNFDIILYDDQRREVARKYISQLESNTFDVVFNGQEARYIKVELKTHGVPLSLAEVEVYPFTGETAESTVVSKANLALGKQAIQSSEAYGGNPSRAIDGNTDGDYGHGSVTHTREDSPSWWQLDLGEEYSLSEIILYNRTDAEPERLSNFDIVLLNNAGQEVAHQSIDSLDRSSLAVQFDSLEARYVKISLKTIRIPLSLAEVEVFGTK